MILKTKTKTRGLHMGMAVKATYLLNLVLVPMDLGLIEKVRANVRVSLRGKMATEGKKKLRYPVCYCSGCDFCSCSDCCSCC